MGVSLERVQNKFACIIGELCSEPDILSEFAIWLDLRLAEYKSKGSISLECSGEAPSPSWLRGHKGPPKRIKQRESTLQIQPHYEPSQEYNDNLKHETTHERLSPELVYIKEEPAEVFPVSVHSQEEFTPSRNHARKRSAPVPSSEIADDSPYKMHKLSSSSSILEPVNQSLMSIISESGLDESAEMSADMSADFSIIDTPKGNNSLNPIPSTSTGESSDLQVQDDINSAVPDFGRYRLSQCTTKYYVTVPEVRARMGAVQGISIQRLKQIAGAVAYLERWICKREDLVVHLEDLPPSVLNQYLTDFYPTFKKVGGEDYDLGYLKKFRCCIDRFLAIVRYPQITRASKTFESSNVAFAQLKMRIQNKQKLK